MSHILGGLAVVAAVAIVVVCTMIAGFGKEFEKFNEDADDTDRHFGGKC